jgi:hypothetical protein
MKIIRIGALLLVAFLCSAATIVVRGPVVHPSGGGPAPGAFTDDFNRSDGAIGSNWSNEAGTFDVNSNTARDTTNGSDAYCIYNTSVGNVDQYARIVVTTGQQQYPMILLRFVNSASPFYRFYFAPDGGTSHTANWDVAASVGGAITAIQNSSIGGFTFPDGTEIGVTITGTGTGTTLRFFIGVTNAAPISATEWDPAQGAASTFSNDPGVAADTGTKVGMGGYQTSANALTYTAASGGPL